MKSTSRCWLAYEKNQLLKHGFDLTNLDQYGDQPVEYITGWADFYGYQFRVSPAVLIPRVESEQLVSMSVEWLLQLKQENVSWLEIGTGSGAIGISLGLELIKQKQSFSGVLTDIDSQAVRIAKKNLKLNLKNPSISSSLAVNKYQFELICSDMFTQIDPAQKFDVIVANLPYLPTVKLDQLPSSVRDYEPRLALDGGQSGLELILKLLKQAKPWAKPHTRIMLEVDESIRNYLPQLESVCSQYQLSCDIFGKDRFVVIDGFNVSR